MLLVENKRGTSNQDPCNGRALTGWKPSQNISANKKKSHGVKNSQASCQTDQEEDNFFLMQEG